MINHPVLYSLSLIIHGARAAVLVPRAGDSEDRSWQAAVQDINGMLSIITLLPVLTGKAQNVKLIASRILPASFVIAGLGAGRVLAKLQMGILLCGFNLYRNVVGEVSYPHDEYVNRFSPDLEHVPTNTPERHAKGTYVNHNAAETYLVEAWFRTQGQPAIVELCQNNYLRMAIGFIVYICLYAGETYLAMRNAAINCGPVFLVVQASSACLWMVATIIAQIRKGQGRREISLNQTAASESNTLGQYRHFRLPVLGRHVSSTLLSFHMDNLEQYQLFGSAYESPTLVFAGALTLLSGALDILSTVLIIGKTTWAYPWIGTELCIIFAKVLFCIEPLRYTEIRETKIQTTLERPYTGSDRPLLLPLEFHTTDTWRCLNVTTSYNLVEHLATKATWQSTSAGLSIGQQYISININGERLTKYLAVADDNNNKLELVDIPPTPQTNHALQREFLAALAAVVVANKIPSRDFIAAIDSTMANIKSSMPGFWYHFGSKDVTSALLQAKRTLVWRTFA